MGVYNCVILCGLLSLHYDLVPTMQGIAQKLSSSAHDNLRKNVDSLLPQLGLHLRPCCFATSFRFPSPCFMASFATMSFSTSLKSAPGQPSQTMSNFARMPGARQIICHKGHFCRAGVSSGDLWFYVWASIPVTSKGRCWRISKVLRIIY